MIKRYNAKDLSIMADGIYITGLGEDMVSWEKEEAYFDTSVGAQGDIVKNEINNDIHNLTVTVQATSPQLSTLMDLMKKQATFPVWAINKSLGLRFGGENANIKEQPELSLGTEADDVEFTFCVFDGITEAL